MGSSGNSTGPHLHFTPYYHRCQVEMGYDTADYEGNPMPYSGDVAPFAMDYGVSAYNPNIDLDERPATITTARRSRRTTPAPT